MHKQAFVKVNARVDKGVAGRAGLENLYSCISDKAALN